MLSVGEFLDSVADAALDVEDAEARLRVLRSRCEKTTSTITGMPRGGGADAQAAWASLAEEPQRLEACRKLLRERTELCDRLLAALSDRRYRQVLRMRHLEPELGRRAGWKSIAGRMHYGESRTRDLYGEAMREAQQIYDAMLGTEVLK